MRKEFVVVSGIPGSGKTTLAWQLQPMLEFPVIDKDDILERLLSAEGARAAARRQELSRESDAAFQRLALRAERAILVSFWHVPGMRSNSGTPTEWLGSNGHAILHVRCRCDPAIAAHRFLERKRHPGHGDRDRSLSELVAEFSQLAALGAPSLGNPVEVDTGATVDFARLVTKIQIHLAAAKSRVTRST